MVFSMASCPRALQLKKLGLIVAALILVEPQLFKEPPFSMVDRLYIVGRILLFIFLTWYFVAHRIRWNKLLVYTAAFELVLLGSTLMHSPSSIISPYLGPATAIISVVLLYTCFRDDYYQLLRSFRTVFALLFAINLITVFIAVFNGGDVEGLRQFDSRINDCYYFLGMDNRFIFFFIPAITCSVLINNHDGKRFDPYLIFFLLQGLLSLTMVWAVGGMIGMFAIASAVIVTHTGKVKHEVSARKVVIASLLIAVGVAIISFTDAANLMLNVTDALLHKRATVESRFDLWGGAMRAFSDSPIVGIGYQGVDGLYGYLHGSGHAHNIWFNTAMRSGVVGVLILCLILFHTSSMIEEGAKSMGRRVSNCLSLILLSCLIIDLADSYDDYLFFMTISSMVLIPRLDRNQANGCGCKKILHANLDGEGGAYGLIKTIQSELSDEIVFDYFSMGTFSCEQEVRDVQRAGGTVYQADLRSNRLLGHLLLPFKFYSFLQKGDYEVVHIHGDSSWKILLYNMAAQTASINRIILHAHAAGVNGDAKKLKHFLHRVFSRVNGSMGETLLACSEEAAVWVYGKERLDRVVVVPNGIDVRRFAFCEVEREEIRKQLGYEADDIVLGLVGDYSPVKNFSFAMEVLRSAAKKKENLKLLVLGDGCGRRDFEERIERCGLGGTVTCVGRVMETPKYYSAMDCLLMPSLSEGMPLVAIEAQANGLTCLLSDQITEQICILDSSSRLPINQGVQCWIDNLPKTSKYDIGDRASANDSILNSRFNVESAAGVLRNVYLDE